MQRVRQQLLSFGSLFTSVGTLLCCALPALLVSLGAGATLVSILGVFPQIIWLSEHKDYLFAGSGFLLAMNSLWLWRQRNAPCPIDPVAAKNCTRARRLSKYILFFSITVYLVGFFFAYLVA